MTTKSPKGRLDLSQLAKRIVDEATGESTTPVIESRIGRVAGGKARAASLSKDERIDLARLAANARWKKKS